MQPACEGNSTTQCSVGKNKLRAGFAKGKTVKPPREAPTFSSGLQNCICTHIHEETRCCRSSSRGRISLFFKVISSCAMTHILSFEMEKCTTKCSCTLTSLSNTIGGTTESQRCSSKTAKTKLMAVVAVFLPGPPGPEMTQNINIENSNGHV